MAFQSLSSSSKKSKRDLNAIDAETNQFNMRMEDYLSNLLELQALVRTKLASFPSTSGGDESGQTLSVSLQFSPKLSDGIFILAMKFEADPEASSATKSKPIW